MKIFCLPVTKRTGRVFMQHLSNSFYILSVSYSLSASDTDDYYNNLCNLIWPPLVPHMFEISSGNTFLISASPRTLPLAHYQYIWILLTCFASGWFSWATSKVSKTRALLFECPMTKETILLSAKSRMALRYAFPLAPYFISVTSVSHL